MENPPAVSKITAPRDRKTQLIYHTKTDPHRRVSSLRDVILGGQDGLVNTLGVILGVAAATSDTRIIIAAGLAATFAEAVSMGAVAYTSMLADHAFYESEKAREYRHVREAPLIEREEIREIYAAKGFSGELLDRIVNTICADKDVWVQVMMAEEHQLTPVNRRTALRSAIIVFFAALIGALIPLMPFMFLPVMMSVMISLIVAALTLFIVGWYKARTMVGNPMKSGMEMAVIGVVSALVGYAVGLIFAVPGTPAGG